MKFKWLWDSKNKYEGTPARFPTATDSLGKIIENINEKTAEMKMLADSISFLWEKVYEKNLELVREKQCLEKKVIELDTKLKDMGDK